jgi:pimeloyl-ACP methyl ester carboxylesterase/DNA-binding CsgD family transcriptional regulator
LSEPTTQYALSGSLHIAYQEFGEGPVDIVLVPGFISHIEYAWKEPFFERFLRSLGTFARVITYDKRGMGLSDHDPARITPTLQQRCDDVLAVMDATHSSTAYLLAWSEGGPAAISVAAESPDRVQGLILIGTAARFSLADDYPIGVPAEILDEFATAFESLWGTGVGLELFAPSIADIAATRSWWAAYQRFAASPGAVAASLRMQLDIDVRNRLEAVASPTLVVHGTQDLVVPVECGRYLAAHLGNAVMLERNGTDHMYWITDQVGTLTAIRQFLATATPELQRIPRPRRPSHGWDSLTSAELEIARLVAQGLTNREIAGRLTLSPRTIQTHVAHILAKLGQPRRANIAAELAGRQAREA